MWSVTLLSVGLVHACTGDRGGAALRYAVGAAPWNSILQASLPSTQVKRHALFVASVKQLPSFLNTISYAHNGEKAYSKELYSTVLDGL
jgi:hypothetical protein